MDKRELVLLAFPLLQIASFVAGCLLLSDALPAAVMAVLVSALCLSFALHITYHYHVHFKRRSPVFNRAIDLGITALTGLPFHYYQLLHWNHHKYDNAIGDFTSTWTTASGRPVPKNLFAYSLLWPVRRDIGLRDQFAIARRDGYFKPVDHRRLRTESILLAGLYAVLAWLGIRYVGAYLVMVYAGWTLIAMHNYGQHLPNVYGASKGESYYGKLYNLLTVYNGLHSEHHHRPSVKYWQLAGPMPRSEIRRPHLLEGLHFTLRRSSPDRRSRV